MSLFYNLTNLCDSCSFLFSLLFLLPKTEFVSSFAFVLFRFLRFFTKVTWHWYSPAQIFWLCRPLNVIYLFYLLLFGVIGTIFPYLFALLSLSAEGALLDCVIDWKERGIIFEAILSLSERYQNIQDNPENFCREYVVFNEGIPKLLIINSLLTSVTIQRFRMSEAYWGTSNFASTR